jgi:hypothetical protein
MAGVKISNLPAVPVAPDLGDLLAEVQPAVGGVTYKVTLSQIATLFGFSGGIVQPIAGGTGVSSPTIHTLPVAQGAAPFNFLGPLTNGQLLIGSTGVDPVAGAITGSLGITVTLGAGTINISGSGGGLTWTEVTGATQVLAVSNGYISNRGGGVAFSLPATSAVGDVFSIVGKLGIWSITQGAGQQINVGAVSTTLGATGTLTSAAATDSANFVCITANTIWQVQGGPQTAGFVLA